VLLLSALLSVGPSRVLGLHGRKGVLARDADADVLVWDPVGRAGWCIAIGY
jgi:dihydroorotase-like cyclic amidohydrolase